MAKPLNVLIGCEESGTVDGDEAEQLAQWAQTVQPNQFGDRALKRTCLWLRGGAAAAGGYRLHSAAAGRQCGAAQVEPSPSGQPGADPRPGSVGDLPGDRAGDGDAVGRGRPEVAAVTRRAWILAGWAYGVLLISLAIWAASFVDYTRGL